MEILATTHGGISTTDFNAIASDRIATAGRPKFDKLYSELVFRPMLELIDYLQPNGFKTFIVSGGGLEFMRPWTEEVYDIPPEQVVGSSIKTELQMENGEPVLMRLAEIDFIDDKEGKPVVINSHIRPPPDRGLRQLGRRPRDAAMERRRRRRPADDASVPR